MKELTIEQKAQRYNEAFRIAQELYNNSNSSRIGKSYVCTVFPELKESEDERIKKALIDYFDDANKADENPLRSYDIYNDKVIAWLKKQGTSYTKRDVDDAYLKGITDTKNETEKQYEANYPIRKDIATFIFKYKGDIKDRAKWMDYLGIKVSFVEMQGEQKSADKVKPKFHKGDWIIYQGTENIYQVVAVIDNQYQLKYGDTYTVQKCADVDRCARLWDITKDAKDGDVLACNNGWTCIFKTLVNDETFSSYCFMDNTKWFCETGSECHTLKEEFVKVYNGKIYPATKEQRELLFQKMKEAGYEWDAEKKELKKIEDEKYNGEDYGIDSLYHAKRILEKTLGSVDGYQSDDGILEHKCAITAVKKLYEQKPTWSEEDENRINRLIAYFEDKESFSAEDDIVYANWLKSLRPPKQWKPSEEQIATIEYIIRGYESTAIHLYAGAAKQLYLLLEQFKQL